MRFLLSKNYNGSFVDDVGASEHLFMMKGSQWLGIYLLVNELGCAHVPRIQNDD